MSKSNYSARIGVARGANMVEAGARRPAVIGKIRSALLTLTLLVAVALEVSAASATERTDPTPFEFLVAILVDAEKKGLLSEDLKGLLADQFIEIVIVPFTGEAAEEVGARLSEGGQSAFQFLTAVIEDANKGVFPDELGDALSDWLIDTLIAPYTGETPEQVADRISASPASIPIYIPPADDREALIRFFNATGGPNWTNNENWLSDEPVEQWYGVETDDMGRVTGLYLDNNRVVGEIPPELGSLADLTSLYLNDNNLSGPIPFELGNLSDMVTLNLSGNRLSGHIPPELGNLTSSYYLQLSWNQLSGPIPHELGNLSNLEILDLSNNELSGALPPELGNLSNLEILDLWGNELSGTIPPELGNLTSLDYLFLSENQLSGPIPHELGNLSNLEILGLSGNELSGAIPPELGNITSLYSLRLLGNELTGCLPIGLSHVQEIFIEPPVSFCTSKDALVALYNATDGDNWIDNTNWLSDEPVGEWYGIDADADGRVFNLDLSGNNLDGHIPHEIGSLSDLESLSLYDNNLSGTIPPELSNLTDLGILYLMDNNLSGTIPPELGNLTSLYYLSLSDNELSGTIPPELGNLTDLIILGLSNNKLSGTIPPKLGNLTRLEGYLDLWGNKLSGTIPPELGNLTSLYYLSLSDNELSGTIPPELGNLTRLEHLFLQGNELTGCLPIGLSHVQEIFFDPSVSFCVWEEALVALYNATDGDNWIDNANWLSDEPIGEWYGIDAYADGRVSRLDLSGNNLNGQISPELGNLRHLESLSLYDNELSGTIPPELGDLANLKEMFLHGNRLNGRLPPELDDLTNLTRVFMGGNRFDGCIPDALGNAPYNDLSILNMRFCASRTYPAPSSTRVAAFSISPTQISLTWSCGLHDAGSREIYRNGVFAASLPPEDCSYTDEELDPNARYHYRIEFHDAEGAVETAQANVATLAYPPKTYFPLNITDSGFQLAIVDHLNPPETEYRVEIQLPPPPPPPEPTATPGPLPTYTRIIERGNQTTRQMFIAPAGSVERSAHEPGRVFADHPTSHLALHTPSHVAIEFGRVFDGSKTVVSDWSTSKCRTLEDLEFPLIEVEVITRNLDGIETAGSSREDGFPGAGYFFLQERTGNDDPWAISRINSVAAIYNLTENAHRWMLSDIYVERFRNEPGFAGYRGTIGTGIGYTVRPGVLMHETMHGYWGNWDNFPAPCDMMNIYTFRRDVAQFMLDFRKSEQSEQPNPWEEWAPLYKYLIGVAEGHPDFYGDDRAGVPSFWQLLEDGNYDELWGLLYHTIDTEIPSTTAGKFSLIPPPLRPYFEGFISDNEDKATTWHDELLWYINLPPLEKRLWDTGYNYHSVVAHSRKYHAPPDGRISTIPPETRELLRNADRRALVDFINTLEDISCNLQDPCQELWNSDFGFWSAYVWDNLYRATLYQEELSPSVGIELERSNLAAVKEALRMLATDVSNCGEAPTSALRASVNSVEGITDRQKNAFLAMIEVRERHERWNLPCTR